MLNYFLSDKEFERLRYHSRLNASAGAAAKAYGAILCVHDGVTDVARPQTAESASEYLLKAKAALHEALRELDAAVEDAKK